MEPRRSWSATTLSMFAAWLRPGSYCSAVVGGARAAFEHAAELAGGRRRKDSPQGEVLQPKQGNQGALNSLARLLKQPRLGWRRWQR